MVADCLVPVSVIREFRFVLPGACLSHPRPRISRWGGVHMPKRYMEYKNSQMGLLGKAYVEEPIECPVEVELLFLFDRPRRLLRRKDPDGRLVRTGREDLDNLVKTVLDCLEDGGVLKNDRQVWSLVASQYYCARVPCESACVEVLLRHEG